MFNTLFENLAVHVIMCKNMVGTEQATDNSMTHGALHTGYLRLQTHTQNM